MAIMKFLERPWRCFSTYSFRIDITMFPQLLHRNAAQLDLLYTGLCWISYSKLLDNQYYLLGILVEHWYIQAGMMYYSFLPCHIISITHVVITQHVSQFHLPNILYGYKVINNLLLSIDPLIHLKICSILIRLTFLSFTIVDERHIHGKVTFLLVKVGQDNGIYTHFHI